MGDIPPIVALCRVTQEGLVYRVVLELFGLLGELEDVEGVVLGLMNRRKLAFLVDGKLILRRELADEGIACYSEPYTSRDHSEIREVFTLVVAWAMSYPGADLSPYLGSSFPEA